MADPLPRQTSGNGHRAPTTNPLNGSLNTLYGPVNGAANGVNANAPSPNDPYGEVNADEPVTPGATGPLNADAEPVRRLRLTPASQIQIRPVRWLWEDRIPAGAIALIPGREGIGKSLLLAWLTARITRGELPGVRLGQPRPVIYAATEDSWAYTIAPRLLAAGADLDLVYRVDVDNGGLAGQLTLPHDCELLGAEITRLGVALLAADPLLSLISSRIDTFKDQQLRTALEPLFRMAEHTGCSVVGLAHFNKSAGTDALSLITGSRAFAAVSRAVLAVARDPQSETGECVLTQAKNNLGRLDLPSLTYIVNSAEIDTPEGAAHVGVLTFTGQSERTVSDILTEAGTDPAERAERDDAAAWVRDYLTGQGGEAPFPDVLKAARAEGIAERTLRRARTRAGVTAQREGFPARTVWRLPDEHTPSPQAPARPRSGQSGQSPQGGRTDRTAAGLDSGHHTASPPAGQQTAIPDTCDRIERAS